MPSIVHPCVLEQASFLEQCQVQFSRRGGPGGQHRNKTETAAIIVHQPTGITGEASERRSQAQNRSVALRRLRILLALNVRGVQLQEDQSPKNAEPSTDEHDDCRLALWEERLLNQRQMVSPDHWDFPTVLSLAIDRLDSLGFELGIAAKGLGISTAQLSKLLRQDPLVMQWVNQARQKNGLGRIR